MDVNAGAHREWYGILSKFYYFNSDITARLHKNTTLKYAVQTVKSRNVSVIRM